MTETDAFQALRFSYPNVTLQIDNVWTWTMRENGETIRSASFNVSVDFGEITKSGDSLRNIVRELCDLAKLENYRKEHAQ